MYICRKLHYYNSMDKMFIQFIYEDPLTKFLNKGWTRAYPDYSWHVKWTSILDIKRSLNFLCLREGF